MALPKTEKKIDDMNKADEMWKCFIRAEDDSHIIWQSNWGWIMEQYRSLESKLKEKSKQSKFLTQILEDKKEDSRKVLKGADTSNHVYGYLTNYEEFQLEIYGPDIFKPKPLPPIYHLPKQFE
ncbi:unnamed protein product [Ceutorhynchus assimilis]|uniref:Uncharacterized protein n=1 Tax=Ceutorhynchus assimilis TaxID=467358 RepID=A0A9N9ME94_9CUCU|nr:unnamed protein product [Ceutorhynchus assimilis]